MSDNPGAAVAPRAIRHFHLFCDASPNVVFALWFRRRRWRLARMHARLRTRHRLREAARSPVMFDALWGHATRPKPPINSTERRCSSRSKGSSSLQNRQKFG
jgi:hypothetical protein